MFKLKRRYEDIVSSLFGGGSAGEVGGDAAGAISAGNQQAIRTIGVGGERAIDQQRASRDQSIAVIREMLGFGRQGLSPFAQAGQRQLPGLESGATVGGFDERLSQIFNTDIFGALNEERGRAVQGQLAAGGLTRSGTAINEAAAVPTDIALQIENLLTGRSQQIAGQGLNAGFGLADLSQGAGSNIANINQQQAGNISNILTGTALEQARLQSGIGQAESSGILTTGQAKAAGGENLLNTAATLGSIFFSDPNLKENIEQIGQVGPLPLMQWDWIEKAKDISLISDGLGMGFLTTDVIKHFPQHVYNYCGFDCIDYSNLLNDLEAA